MKKKVGGTDAEVDDTCLKLMREAVQEYMLCYAVGGDKLEGWIVTRNGHQPPWANRVEALLPCCVRR